MKDHVSVQNFCLVIPVSGKPKVASCDYGTTQYDSGAATVGGDCSVWQNCVCLILLQLAWLVDSISADNQTGMTCDACVLHQCCVVQSHVNHRLAGVRDAAR